MRDPHVVALHYRLETGPQLVFANPEPLECKTDTFTLRLADGHLRVELKDHFPTEEAAQLEVKEYLRSWEIAAALRDGPGAISFVFDRAEVIDRDPPPPGRAGNLHVHVGDAVSAIDGGVARASRARYPDPPVTFTASPDVIAMWGSYEGYVAGRELLTEVAWWCLTTIEWLNGGLQRAAARYAISYNVLKKLSRLAHVGDERTARKRFAGQELRPHTPAETAWMEAVVKRLIQRVGEWRAEPNASWPRITMKNFPRI